MKYGYFGLGLLLFGCFGLVVIVMFQSITINNDSEYYNLKEAMKAAMIESVDMACYRMDERVRVEDECGSGKLKISEQKFVENFTRRFASTVGGNAEKYKIKFYDIIESPPKASVVIEGLTGSYGAASNYESLTIMNSLTGVLEQEKIVLLENKRYRIIDDSRQVIAVEPDVSESDDSSTSSAEDTLDFNFITTNTENAGISNESDDDSDYLGSEDCSNNEENCR